MFMLLGADGGRKSPSSTSGLPVVLPPTLWLLMLLLSYPVVLIAWRVDAFTEALFVLVPSGTVSFFEVADE